MRADVKGETSIPFINKLTECGMITQQTDVRHDQTWKDDSRSTQQSAQPFCRRKSNKLSIRKWVDGWSDCLRSAETFLNLISVLIYSDHVMNYWMMVWIMEHLKACCIAITKQSRTQTDRWRLFEFITFTIADGQWTSNVDKAQSERSEKV